jgi:RHS repeat-associated protein
MKTSNLVGIRTCSDYSPFGVELDGRTVSGGYRYGFQNQEKDDEVKGEGNSVNYTYRMHDSRLGRWCNIDPLVEKYPTFSPFCFTINSPMMFLDYDGRDIILMEAIKLDWTGNYVYKSGQVSQKTVQVIRDLLNTPEGLSYFSQFANKGDVICGHKFNEDGIFAKHDLIIQDFSLSQNKNEVENIPIAVEGGYIPRLNKKEKKIEVFIQLMSFDQSRFDLGETAAHEIGLHGYITSKLIIAYNNGGEKAFDDFASKLNSDKDHKALKKKDTNHVGFRKYHTIMKELIQVNPGYKKARLTY